MASRTASLAQKEEENEQCVNPCRSGLGLKSDDKSSAKRELS